MPFSGHLMDIKVNGGCVKVVLLQKRREGIMFLSGFFLLLIYLSFFLSFPLFLSFLNNLLTQYDRDYLKENKTSSNNKIMECIFIIPHVKMAD